MKELARSEWVDFCLYSLQAVLLWIALPLWGARFLRPLQVGRGGIKALQAWGALSVFALLACRLDRAPPPLSAAYLHVTVWEALLKTSSLLLALGLVWAGAAAWSVWRRMKSGIALQENSEQMLLLTRDDYLPRSAQYLVYALLLVALVTGPFARMIWPDRVHGVWGNFFTSLLMATLLFFAAAGSVLRAPSPLDLALGERYRRMEVRSYYLLMACLALLQMAGLALQIAGESSRRNVALLVSAFVSVTLTGFMLVSSSRQKKGPAVASRP